MAGMELQSLKMKLLVFAYLLEMVFQVDLPLEGVVYNALNEHIGKSKFISRININRFK